MAKAMTGRLQAPIAPHFGQPIERIDGDPRKGWRWSWPTEEIFTTKDAYEGLSARQEAPSQGH